MTDQMTDSPANAITEKIIGQVLGAWNTQNKALTAFFEKYDASLYLNEVASGRNRGVYLLGHLVAAHDNMLPLLGFGERLFPEYEGIFLTNADKSVSTIPSVNELRKNLETLNKTLSAHFEKVTPGGWLDRHTKVSPEDFILAPERNRLNVLMSRTSHVSYHLGQLNLMKPVNLS